MRHRAGIRPALVIGAVGDIDLRCLWPDSEFTIVNDSADRTFTFKARPEKVVLYLVADFAGTYKPSQREKVVSMPGVGAIYCQVTDSTGDEATAWLTITVE